MAATPIRRVLAGTLLAAGLATFGAGAAFAADPGGALPAPEGSSNGSVLDLVVTQDFGDPGGDDLTRKGYGDPIGDAGQLKVYRPY
ncbi:hypothetical protein [Gordonia aquimaris]|uniref:Uncharacterized protein n=1 Tax=Gordonia aquimaris TaxID=2984863 RepID=A0A9X3I6L3_9ACTN|nr:hypothetical protein [Gordonia aquimaris]MCX2966195.1 hypothetical protein [Gordonia aquimaris]